ncbi:MAG: hypothetical protein ACRDE2_02860 [Chitinophagaceae bacterium]
MAAKMAKIVDSLKAENEFLVEGWNISSLFYTDNQSYTEALKIFIIKSFADKPLLPTFALL